MAHLITRLEVWIEKQCANKIILYCRFSYSSVSSSVFSYSIIAINTERNIYMHFDKLLYRLYFLFAGTESSDIPHFCCSSSVCALSWRFQACYIPVNHRWLFCTPRTLLAFTNFTAVVSSFLHKNKTFLIQVFCTFRDESKGKGNSTVCTWVLFIMHKFANQNQRAEFFPQCIRHAVHYRS